MSIPLGGGVVSTDLVHNVNERLSAAPFEGLDGINCLEFEMTVMMNEKRTSSSRGTLQLTKCLRAGEPGSGVRVVPELRFVSSNDGGEGISRSMGARGEACVATSTLSSGKS